MVNIFLRRAWLAVLIGIVAVGARAAAPYLSHYDPLTLVPTPPAVGSGEDKVDRDSAFEVYSARTHEDAVRAKAEHEFDVFVFGPAIGPEFTAEHCPRTAALFAEVLKEVKAVTDKAKYTWNRPRPYVLEPVRFDHHEDTEKSPSYPSGHSTRGTTLAFLLAEIYPDHRDAILAKGRLIGWTRVEAGVHTPLDIYAGRVLGQSLAQAFLRNPAFQADLEAAKAEAESAQSQATH